MDTNRIKRFATEARNILKAGIAAKITTLGFDKKGNVAEEHRPQLMQGGALWNGQFYTEGFYYQWMSLYNRIQQKGMKRQRILGSIVCALFVFCRRTISVLLCFSMPMLHVPQLLWTKHARVIFHR